jgi:hypothetical protein
MSPGHIRLAVPLAALCIAAGVGSCGSGGGSSTSTSSASGPQGGTHTVTITRPSVAKTIPAEGEPGSYAGVDYADYERALQYDAYLINRYWSQAVPRDLHARYPPAPHVIAYDLDDSRPNCDGRPVQPHDAEYCFTNNTVVVDEPGFLIPFYREVGPAADAVILAHEWGHAVQGRTGIAGRLDVQEDEELNADCWAGVWARGAVEGGVLDKDDLIEAEHQLYLVGDPHSVNWRSPQAHGTPKERVESFESGLNGGIDACLDQARALQK